MKTLVFGKNSSIGVFIASKFENTTTVSHSDDLEIFINKEDMFDAVIWCNGVNCNDTIYDANEFDYIMNANVNYIVKTLQWLLNHNKLATNSKLCVISSLWGSYFTRKNKFSYTVSKSALDGLVRSCAVDLYDKGLLINSISPGPLDTPMTRTHVKNIDKVHFVSMDDVLNMVKFLCFDNKTITGQNFILDACNTTVKIE